MLCVNLKESCVAPFNRIAIFPDGNCYMCACYTWEKSCIGNIYQQTFDEIWYGEKAVNFRKSVLDGSYKFCNKNLCFKKELSSFDDGREFCFYPPYPKIVDLCYVKACNVRCITCRDCLYYESAENTKFFDELSEKILPVLKLAEYVYLSGSGEIFVSPHLKHLLKKVSYENSGVKYRVISNGTLFDEKHCREFSLVGKMDTVQISLHSATKKTYDKIVRGGDFCQVLKNLKWLSENKQEMGVNFISVMFAISSVNYRDMVGCVKLAKKLGVIVEIFCVKNWHSTEMFNHFEDYTVWSVKHKEYKNFLRELKKLRKYKGWYYFSDVFLEKLQKSMSETWVDRLMKLFWKVVRKS